MERVLPTLKQWEKLYEAAGFIKQLKPWEYLWEDNIIAIQLPERKEPVFCSVLGANDEMYAIIVYPDNRSFAERNQLLTTPNIPEYIFMSRQNCLVCNFGSREELSNEDYKIIKGLGLKFRGKNQWIYFHSYKPGYAPWSLDSGETDVMIGALQNFIMAFRCYLEGKLNVDFKRGKILFRFYDKEKKLWYNCEIDISETPKLVPKRVTVKDEIYLARLKAIKKTNLQIEVELLYLPTPIQKKKDEVPYYPKMCVIADKNSGAIIDQHILSSGEKEENIILSSIDRFISQYGRPRVIHIRDEIVEGLIGDLCTKCGIEIKKSSGLAAIDSFVEAFL